MQASCTPFRRMGTLLRKFDNRFYELHYIEPIVKQNMANRISRGKPTRFPQSNSGLFTCAQSKTQTHSCETPNILDLLFLFTRPVLP